MAIFQATPGLSCRPFLCHPSQFSQLQQQWSESPLSAAAVAPELRLSGSVPRFFRGALRFSLEQSTLSAAVYRVPTGSHGAYLSFRPRDGAVGISLTLSASTPTVPREEGTQFRTLNLSVASSSPYPLPYRGPPLETGFTDPG